MLIYRKIGKIISELKQNLDKNDFIVDIRKKNKNRKRKKKKKKKSDNKNEKNNLSQENNDESKKGKKNKNNKKNVLNLNLNCPPRRRASLPEIQIETNNIYQFKTEPNQ